ncbi:uncharacterized protein F5147DRAFT_833797 [Suillus discolor]|uniref:Uncharacterized protein n=1 Tax=Suillus discolor TaxID=1912936 RepID=A0A9P7FGV5_9AGAM|nr:uncharacterized protein F5147DRAFT_833797 [Suillus discolor]KAG2116624.1 hypothetical protein F5147DRAFT_833797 [Suillus discolor]
MFTIFLVAAAATGLGLILISSFKATDPYLFPKRPSFILCVIQTFLISTFLGGVAVASISILLSHYTGFRGFPIFLAFWGVKVICDIIYLIEAYRHLLARHQELDWFWRYSPELHLRYPNLKTKLSESKQFLLLLKNRVIFVSLLEHHALRSHVETLLRLGLNELTPVVPSAQIEGALRAPSGEENECCSFVTGSQGGLHPPLASWPQSAS